MDSRFSYRVQGRVSYVGHIRSWIPKLTVAPEGIFIAMLCSVLLSSISDISATARIKHTVLKLAYLYVGSR
jgi:hypothetical protein